MRRREKSYPFSVFGRDASQKRGLDCKAVSGIDTLKGKLAQLWFPTAQL
jgi:hypothetical protein